MDYVTKENTRFKAVSSSGPGGQNVNKRATKVQVWVKIDNLPISDDEKTAVREKIINHINKRDEFEMFSEEERSQEQNHNHALERMNQMIAETLRVDSPRVPTKPSRGAKEERLRHKHLRYEKKKSRRDAKVSEVEEIPE